MSINLNPDDIMNSLSTHAPEMMQKLDPLKGRQFLAEKISASERSPKGRGR
jgi:hypothetical protein